MPSLLPAPPSKPRAIAIRERKIPAIKIIVTILSAIVLLLLANTVRSGSDESATSLSTQSIVSFPANQSPAATAIATTVPLIPTTAPLLLPSPTPTPAPVSTSVPTPQPAATAVPAPTEEPAAAAPEPAAQTLSLSAQAAAPAAATSEPAPSEPDPTPVPTDTPAAAVPTSEPTATSLPAVETPVVIEEVPTATPEPTPTPTPTPTPEPVNIYELELYVLGEINQVRANAGLAPIILDEPISLISRDWSTQMATGGFFEHRPGSQLDVMMPQSWLRWGENIASAPDIKYAQDSLEASPGHYKNMVGDYTHVGIGVYSTGRQVWVTQNFGKY